MPQAPPMQIYESEHFIYDPSPMMFPHLKRKDGVHVSIRCMQLREEYGKKEDVIHVRKWKGESVYTLMEIAENNDWGLWRAPLIIAEYDNDQLAHLANLTKCPLPELQELRTLERELESSGINYRKH